MFNDQEGGMLDYYDLTTQRGKKGKKKINKNDENRNKQKIFKLEEITIPETITVKDFAAELKKTTVKEKIKSYRKENPNGTKMDCVRELGISKTSVYQNWD